MNEKQFKALSVEQRKAVQQKLQDAGHYTGAIDGHWGDTTKSAMELEDKALTAARATADTKEERAAAARLAEKNADIEAERVRQAGKSKDVEDEGAKAANAEKLAKLMLRQRYDEDANSALGLGAKIAAGPVALTGGKALGLGLGAGINAYMNEGQRKKNETLARAAEDRVKGLTTREGAITGTKLAGAMPPATTGGRVLARMAPHMGLGAILAGTGAYTESQVDPEESFYPRMADRAFGVGNIGAGIGLMTQGVKQAAQPGVSPDAAALSVINSSQLRRNNQPPEDAGPKLTPKQSLLAEARSANITGASKMNMTQLKSALVKVGTKTPLIGPAVAGALAYGMTPDSAEAADAGPIASRSEALTNAGVATGIGAGTGYGISKLLEKAPNLARALGIGGAMTAPQMAMNMGPEDSLEHQKERSAIAQNYPGMARFLGIRDEMAQVPERNMGKTDEFATARGLQIPEGIPAPNPDGSSPYPELVSAMMANPQASAAPPPPPSLQQRRLIEAMMQGQR